MVVAILYGCIVIISLFFESLYLYFRFTSNKNFKSNTLQINKILKAPISLCKRALVSIRKFYECNYNVKLCYIILCKRVVVLKNKIKIFNFYFVNF